MELLLAPFQKCLKYDNQSYIITGNNNYKLQNLFKMISEICKKKVKVVYKPSVKSAHYTLTPYAYVPEKSKKFVNSPSDS